MWGGIAERERTPLVVMLSPEICPEYAIGMKLFSAMLFRSSQLMPTTLHSSRTTLDHMFRMLCVNTGHSRMLMWQAVSPDLSLIEHVYDVIERLLCHRAVRLVEMGPLLIRI